jgi:cytochrome c5
MKKLTISALIIASALMACKSSKKSTASATPAKTETPAVTGTVTFAIDIKPILQRYCTRCHNQNEKGGYNFEEISFAKKGGANGELLGTIKHAPGFDPMPANDEPMDAASIAKIEAWVKSGMN